MTSWDAAENSSGLGRVKHLDFPNAHLDAHRCRYGTPTYKPIVWLERPVPLYERIALYSIADVAVVTATRDGMNLVPYEYIVCRQGADVSGCLDVSSISI